MNGNGVLGDLVHLQGMLSTGMGNQTILITRLLAMTTAHDHVLRSLLPAVIDGKPELGVSIVESMERKAAEMGNDEIAAAALEIVRSIMEGDTHQ